MGGHILRGYLHEFVQALEMFKKLFGRYGAEELVSWGGGHLRRISYTLE